eukprot:8406894-Pyramimonas_sp.AAC.1
MHAQRLGMLFQEMNEDSGAMSDGMTVDDLNLQLAKPKVQSWFRSSCLWQISRPCKRSIEIHAG